MDHDPNADAPSEAEFDPTSEIVRNLSQRGEAFGRYRVEEELARGGMGAILRVWDGDLRRHLAMKVIAEKGSSRPGVDTVDAVALGRFLEEAQVTGQLDHPGILPVHELGLDPEGRAYFTMKLVKGVDLRTIFERAHTGEEGWTQTRAVGVLLKVCEAMAYAHDKGVIHRDLKPANIMVGRFGEVYVMDWGLAKVMSGGPSKDVRVDESLGASEAVGSARHDQGEADPGSPLLTMDGDVLGTPAFMSPEQALGKLSRMGPHSDVYSVGAMLYHLLARHMPYVEPGSRPTNYGIWQRVQSGPPQLLQECAPDAPPELVAISEKAMQRKTPDRYTGMSEFADDLRAYLEGRVVRAYEAGAYAELRKWVARNRKFATAAVAALLALVIGLVVSLHLRNVSETQRRNVLNLSVFRELADLRARADGLWPVHPDRIDDYEEWLRDARALVAGLETLAGGVGHRAALAALRASGQPRDPGELEVLVRADPRFAELESLQNELQTRQRAADVRAGRAAPVEFLLGAEAGMLTSRALNSLAWSLVKPTRTVFGREAEGLALGLLARDRADEGDDAAEIADTLAWAYLAAGLDAEALEWARAAIEAAAANGRRPYEEKLRSMQVVIANAAENDAKDIAQLTQRSERLYDEIHGDLGWEFDEERTAWWHEQLARLIRELDAFADADLGLIAGTSAAHGWGIERRLAGARRIAELTIEGAAAQDAWNAAGEALARHREFGGLALRPQPGFLPLGPDPRSGYWEFAHVLTGEVPSRAADGALVLGPETCMVFVLLPGGSFEMGAATAEGAIHFDPLAQSNESRIHPVTLRPYFLSKYELTQAQWTRFVGANPSFFHAGTSKGGRPILGTNPVETVSWWDAVKTLSRMDLELPTEAQWEFAARGGQPTPWYTGPEPASLDGLANLADSAAAESGESWADIDRSLNDGHAGHAPVGSFGPNQYGLHEILGNVEEWCRDSYAAFAYDLVPRTGDGEHHVEHRPQRAIRGGSMTSGAANARCTYREHRQADYALWNLGLRPARALLP